MYKLSYQNLLYFILGVVILILIYKLFKKQSTQNNENIENFESILNKLNKSKNKYNNKQKKRSQKSNFSNTKNTKTTLDDLVAEAEEIEPEKYSIGNIKQEIIDYANSFRKEKFNNTTGTTQEALEKFKLFKEKFFEIFNPVTL